MNTVEIPWPPSFLSPNSRCHWRTKASVGKKYKRDCFYLCKEAGFTKLELPVGEKVHVFMDYYQPSRHENDQDNMQASAKFLLDAIAEALGINDNRFVLHPFFTDALGGKIVVRIATLGERDEKQV